MNEVDLSQKAIEKIEQIAQSAATNMSTSIMAQVATESAKEAI